MPTTLCEVPILSPFLESVSLVSFAYGGSDFPSLAKLSRSTHLVYLKISNFFQPKSFVSLIFHFRPGRESTYLANNRGHL